MQPDRNPLAMDPRHRWHSYAAALCADEMRDLIRTWQARARAAS